MQISNKWAILAVAHLIVIACLAAGVITIALHFRVPGKESAMAIPYDVPSDAEIARLDLVSARIAIIQSNLANADTVGYKRQRANVEDGVSPKLSENQFDMTQGALENTGLNTDVAIQGEGFFRIKIRPNLGDGTAYTRSGALARDSNGNLLVAIGSGFQLQPPINIPPGSTNLSINEGGVVTYQAAAGDNTTKIAGQIMLYQFADAQSLMKSGAFYLETEKSGPPLCSSPGEHGTGTLMQGYLESSNVDPLKEWAYLQRAQNMLQFNTHPAGNRTGKATPVAHQLEPA